MIPAFPFMTSSEHLRCSVSTVLSSATTVVLNKRNTQTPEVEIRVSLPWKYSKTRELAPPRISLIIAHTTSQWQEDTLHVLPVRFPERDTTL